MKRFRYKILDDYEEGVVRPKYRGSGPSETNKALRAARRARAGGRTGSYGHYGRLDKLSASRSSTRQGPDRRQVVIVKNAYRKSKALHSKNLMYIHKEGKGKEGEAPVLYGHTENYEAQADGLHYRMILSPENQNINLTEFTEEYIRRLELQTGYQFRWVASEHYDTPHQHVHILINGKDLTGRRVDPRVIFKFRPVMRDIARDIATEMTGMRTDREMDDALIRSCASQSYGSVDRIIERYLRSGDITLHKLNSLDDGNLIRNRLCVLSKLNLCEYNPYTEVFNLTSGWAEQLKTIGRYSTYLDGLRHSHVSAPLYSLHRPEQDGSIQGTIVARYFMQENSTNHAVVVVRDDGSAAYVPLPFAPTKKSGCVEGARVVIDLDSAAKDSPGGRGRSLVQVRRI